MTTNEKREIIKGVLALVDFSMRESDFKILEMLEGGDGSMESLINATAEYAWDHILGEPANPSAKQIALRYKQLRGTFDKETRLLGRFGWKTTSQPDRFDGKYAIKFFAIPSYSDLVLALFFDGAWVVVKQDVKKPLESGNAKNLEAFLKRRQKEITAELTH